MADPVLSENSSIEDEPQKLVNENRARAARLREQRRRIAKAKANHTTLQPTNPVSEDPEAIPEPDIDQRIDAVKASLASNSLTMLKFISEACSCDYEARRTGRMPGNHLTQQDSEDAKAVRDWAKNIAIQQVIQEANNMQKKNPLCPKGEFVYNLLAQCSYKRPG